MLFKLLKHEFIASYRTYLPVYVGLYGLSILIFFSYQVNANIVAALLIALFSLLEGAMLIFTIYNLVISLGSRVYGKPGYLLFSVPAKTSEIILSKFIANFIWILISIFVSITSLGISFSILGVYDEIGNMVSMIWTTFDFTSLNVAMFIVYGIVIILYYIAFFMFLFALLNLIYKGERKLLIGILFYFILSTIMGVIINAISVPILTTILGTGGENINTIWWVILIYFVITSAFVGATYYFMDKKMELQ